MKKAIIITSLILCIISIKSYAQSIVDAKGKTNIESIQLTKGPNDFPELIFANISGAPKLGAPQLIMGEFMPVMGEGNGWAAPAFYDWDSDGKKDLIIGEFTSGLKIGLAIGNLIRVYQNVGTNDAPKFYDDFYYAQEVGELKESLGTPLSIYTYCCLPFTPRFADLDNDGFIDLLSGQYTPGYITWFRGSERGFLSGIKLQEAYDPIKDKVISINSNYLPITDPKGNAYWSYSSAAFGDFDSDGDQDMIIGGNSLRICENIGNKSAPKFGKRELLFDEQGNQINSRLGVPYVVDWDQDGVLDILLTNSFSNKKSRAITYFRGIKSPTRLGDRKHELQFEVGIPLFKEKNGEKEFPGSWLNICVTDWNNDGVNDLLIGTSVVTLNDEFDHKLSWSWERDTGVSKKNPAYYPVSMKRKIERQIKKAEVYQKKSGLNDEELEEKNHITKRWLIKNYYVKEKYKTLAHKGYVYVMLGKKTSINKKG